MLRKSMVCRRPGSYGLDHLGAAFLEQVAATCLDADARVTDIIIFGSYARGEVRPDSDLDVAVAYSGSDADSRDLVGKVAPAFMRVCGSRNLEYDLVAFSPTGKAYKSYPIYKRIREEGVNVAQRGLRVPTLDGQG